MSRRRFLSLLVAALVVLGLALYLGSRRNMSPSSAQGTAFLPSLATGLGSVTEVDLRKGNTAPAVTLHRVGQQWTVAQRADYPADASKVRKLLLALGDAKIVEEKTSNPANFSIIGVDDPAQPGAQGTEITLLAQDGKHAVIIGKPIGEGDFARRSGENRSFSIEPAISVDAEPRSWIDSPLLDVQAASIQSVELKPAAGAGYVLHRLKPNEDGFALDGAPAGRKVLDAKALAPSPTTLSGLTAEDVAAVDTIDLSKPTQAIFTLTDGNVITLTGASVGDKRWVQVQATKDPALTSKTQNRAFELATYRFDTIFRPLDQLLVPKETKESKAPESKAPAKPAAGRKPPAGTARPAPQSSPVPSP
jgi:hypothetical protein